MTKTQQDRLFRKVLLDALVFEWEDTLNAAPATPMSTKQRKRMNAMLRDPIGYTNRYFRSKWKKITETAAIIFLAITLVFASLYAASPTVRATVSRWFEKLSETYIIYYFIGEKNADTLPHYEIQALPEGYSSSEGIVEMSGYHYITYKSNAGRRIQLEYRFTDDGRASFIKIENMDVQNVTVNGHSGQVFLSPNVTQGSVIVWTDEKAGIQFFIDAYAEKDELILLAESVSICSD